MHNIKLTIAYDGTNYCGWQIQNKPKIKNKKSKIKSIQGVIEEKLSQILQDNVRVIGSGRTDAGVHAWAQVANFKTSSNLEPGKIAGALNSLLPKDISILDACYVPLDFHAQYSVKSKVYYYLILNSRNRYPLLDHLANRISYPINISLMAKEIGALKGRHDFKSFCASGSKVKSYVRTIKEIKLKTSKTLFLNTLKEKDKWVILIIEADGFLYNMVRNIVGTLIDIGRGYLNKGDMQRILKAKNRKLAGATAAAKGLYLCEVKY